MDGGGGEVKKNSNNNNNGGNGSNNDRNQSSAASMPAPPAQKCPRCDSANTKFCYYNNYSLSQPRYFCKTCRRYWTQGGTLRNVPVGGGCRKGKRAKLNNSSAASSSSPSPSQAASSAGQISASTSGSLMAGGFGSFYPGHGGAAAASGFLNSLAAMQSMNRVPAVSGQADFVNSNMGLLQGFGGTASYFGLPEESLMMGPAFPGLRGEAGQSTGTRVMSWQGEDGYVVATGDASVAADTALWSVSTSTAAAAGGGVDVKNEKTSAGGGGGGGGEGGSGSGLDRRDDQRWHHGGGGGQFPGYGAS